MILQHCETQEEREIIQEAEDEVCNSLLQFQLILFSFIEEVRLNESSLQLKIGTITASSFPLNGTRILYCLNI